MASASLPHQAEKTGQSQELQGEDVHNALVHRELGPILAKWRRLFGPVLPHRAAPGPQ